jgi:two-component system chemotaxis response regulator CheB
MTPDISSKSILIIGGSAGSLQVVLGLLSALQTGFPMPVLIVLHRNGVFESSLEELLSTRTTLPIREVEEKDPVLSGTVYVCPADYHVLLEKDRSLGPKGYNIYGTGVG